VRPPRTLLQSRSETSVSPDLCWALGEQAVGRSRSGSRVPHLISKKILFPVGAVAQPSLASRSPLCRARIPLTAWGGPPPAEGRRPLRAHPTGLFTAARPHFTYRKPPAPLPTASSWRESKCVLGGEQGAGKATKGSSDQQSSPPCTCPCVHGSVHGSATKPRDAGSAKQVQGGRRVNSEVCPRTGAPSLGPRRGGGSSEDALASDTK